MPRSWKRKPNHNKRSYVSIPYLHYKKKERMKERKREKMDRWHEKYHQTVVIEAYHQALNKICQDFCTWKVRTTSLS